MPFTQVQTKALSAKLNAKPVRTRDRKGKRLAYLEGWYVIAEANRIFGFDGWDRETIAVQCVWKGTRQGRGGCAYIALVRIQVRVGDVVICREGYGSGHGWSATPGEAHESAIKEAETDTTKRAPRPSKIRSGLPSTTRRRGVFVARSTRPRAMETLRSHGLSCHPTGRSRVCMKNRSRIVRA